jgi:hypothetical protein
MGDRKDNFFVFLQEVCVCVCVLLAALLKLHSCSWEPMCTFSFFIKDEFFLFFSFGMCEMLFGLLSSFLVCMCVRERELQSCVTFCFWFMTITHIHTHK